MTLRWWPWVNQPGATTTTRERGTDVELKNKMALAGAAQTLAESYELIHHNTTTYIPAHWKSEEIEPKPEVEDKIWLPLSRTDKRLLANKKSKILFANDSELASFDYMLKQWATEDFSHVRSIFIRTEEGLRILAEDGTLVEPDGTFLPNFIRPVLNTDEADKAEVFNVIANWLDSEEEAHSLLHHLATSLAPGWSAVKYVLLLGDGRNGKSVLLSMLTDLFGAENVSNITRQEMAEQKPTTVELNNRLLNVVFDGRMDYVKDSGLEKTLIAGEPGFIRMLYESSTTRVQTNALFVEALNKEPKTRDKSSALQKRLVRFWFPKVFARDMKFERKMRSPKMLGAFLALLIEHYVQEHEVVEKLAPSAGAMSLQVNQMWTNSPALQYIDHLVSKDAKRADTFIGAEIDPLVDSFMAWRIDEGFSEYSSADTLQMFRDCFEIDWKTKRDGAKTKRVRKIIGIKPETIVMLEQIREGGEDAGAEDDEDAPGAAEGEG